MDTLITLCVADTLLELHVVHFTGNEALNRPYRFEIDVISPCITLDVSLLTSRCAYLSFGSIDHGIHGVITGAAVRYMGKSISHCRLILEPRLRSLEKRAHRRVIQRLCVPQIIQRLLDEHGMGADHYRFELTIASYPPRVICAQYDEDDLHLLQRLCAEEGIHYRFEHSRDQHLLVFADDPGAFRELPRPILFQKEMHHEAGISAISYMAEHFAIGSISPNHPIPTGNISDSRPADDEQNPLTQPVASFAANQSRGIPFRAGLPNATQANRRRLSEHTLERIRCERRNVQGRSDQPDLVSGHIMSVQAHPDSVFNDQWLLTEVYHAGKQPQWLRDCDLTDINNVVRGFSNTSDQRPEPPHSQSTSSVEWAPFESGYRNHFKVIPWTIPYRPLMTLQQPHIPSPQTATLLGAQGTQAKRDSQGRVQATLHWPDPAPGEEPVVIWLPVAIAVEGSESAPQLLAGHHVLLSHFDNNPDQPVICGYATDVSAHSPRPEIKVDGRPLSSSAVPNHVYEGQSLNVESKSSLILTGQQARLTIEADSIRMTALKPPASPWCQEIELGYGPVSDRLSKCNGSPMEPDFSALLQPLGKPPVEP